jgi:hypothetical protein
LCSLQNDVGTKAEEEWMDLSGLDFCKPTDDSAHRSVVDIRELKIFLSVLLGQIADEFTFDFALRNRVLPGFAPLGNLLRRDDNYDSLFWLKGAEQTSKPLVPAMVL